MAKPMPNTIAIRLKNATNALVGLAASEVTGTIAALSLGWLVIGDVAGLVVDVSQMTDK